MKAIAYLSGTIFSAISVLGILFKIQNWSGADSLLIAGLTGIALLFVPALAWYKYYRREYRDE